MREAENVSPCRRFSVQNWGLWETKSEGEYRVEKEECRKTVVKKCQEREKVEERARKRGKSEREKQQSERAKPTADNECEAAANEQTPTILPNHVSPLVEWKTPL